MPGYTGHQPFAKREAEEEAAMTAAGMRADDGTGTKIPGYKGYVPGIKSENVFAATYGSATRGTAAGIYPKGFDFSDKERYGTVTKSTYTEQMQQKVFGRAAQGAAASPTKSDLSLSYQDAQNQATWARKLQPNEPQKIPMLTDQVLKKVLGELKRRGANGIRGLGVVFRRMDNNGDKRFDREEFKQGLRENGHNLTNDEFNRIFQYFDRNEDGVINFDEFMRGIRGDLNAKRRALVLQAYKKLDRDGNGFVDLRDLAQAYDVTEHPKFISGEMTKNQVLEEFMAQWDSKKKDNKVTQEEFENYYADVSASIDRDDYFELMIRNAWHIAGGEGQTANTTIPRHLVTDAAGN